MLVAVVVTILLMCFEDGGNQQLGSDSFVWPLLLWTTSMTFRNLIRPGISDNRKVNVTEKEENSNSGSNKQRGNYFYCSVIHIRTSL